MKKTFLLLTILILFGRISFAATYLDPELTWKTIETPHFYIHFHNGEEDAAAYLAGISENVHMELKMFLKHEVNKKIQVVLFDHQDYSNGYATVVGNPQITIFLTDSSLVLNKFNYKEWLKFVFIHEFCSLTSFLLFF